MDARLRRRIAIGAVLLLGLALRLLWPTDTWFMSDEATFLSQGRNAWLTRDLWQLGLTGNRGLRYGPFTTWFYAVLLGPGLPLQVALAIKGTLTLAGTLLGAWWFLRGGERRAPVVALGIVAFAPFLLLYGRSPWDNPLVIPLTALGIGAYRRYLDTDRLRWLFGAFQLLTFGMLTHIMAAPAYGAVLLHLLATTASRPRERRRWLAVCEVVAGASLLLVPYFVDALQQRGPSADGGLRLASIVAGIMSGRLVTSFGVDYFTGPIGLYPVGMRGTHLLSWLVVGLIALGVAAIVDDRRDLRARFLDPEIGVPVLVVGLQIGMFFVLDLVGYPHYGNGAWFGFLGLAVLGHRWAARWRPGALIGVAACVALATFSTTMLVTMHERGGGETFASGPWLTQGIAIARALNGWDVPDERISWEVYPYDASPMPMEFLRSYVGSEVIGPSPALPIRVRERSPGDLRDQHVVIVDAEGREIGP